MSRKVKLFTIPQDGEREALAVPNRKTQAVRASVLARTAAVVAIPAQAAAEIVSERNLTACSVNGQIPAIICIYEMAHAAPDWAPLEFGPSSTCAALHLPVLSGDRRSYPALWIDRRYSSHNMALALAEMDFPAIHSGLNYDQWLDFDRNWHERYLTADNRLNLHLATRPNRPSAHPRLFATAEEFTQFFDTCQTGYCASEGNRPATMELTQSGATPFEHQPHTHGLLRTLWGAWPVDGIYKSSGGEFTWRVTP